MSGRVLIRIEQTTPPPPGVKLTSRKRLSYTHGRRYKGRTFPLGFGRGLFIGRHDSAAASHERGTT